MCLTSDADVDDYASTEQLARTDRQLNKQADYIMPPWRHINVKQERVTLMSNK